MVLVLETEPVPACERGLELEHHDESELVFRRF